MKSSISRVVSLFGIVALGVMMLTGLMCIAPDMRTAAQKYYVQQNAQIWTVHGLDNTPQLPEAFLYCIHPQ